MGKSLLIDDGALPWIVKNANNEAAPIRRHIELALCHLAQHGIPLSRCLQHCSFIHSVVHTVCTCNCKTIRLLYLWC